MVLGFHSNIAFISGYASNLSYQSPSLKRDVEHWTKRDYWMFLCWKTSVHRLLYVGSVQIL